MLWGIHIRPHCKSCASCPFGRPEWRGREAVQCPAAQSTDRPSDPLCVVSELREHTNAQAAFQFVEAIVLLILEL